jgi:hypothetical protein
MATIQKSYILTPAQRAEVDQTLATGAAEFANIAHIILESTFNAGEFFEHELQDATPG